MPGMWETPTRERGTPERGGDVLAGPPDGGRPANPWPRLLALALLERGRLAWHLGEPETATERLSAAQ